MVAAQQQQQQQQELDDPEATAAAKDGDDKKDNDKEEEEDAAGAASKADRWTSASRSSHEASDPKQMPAKRALTSSDPDEKTKRYWLASWFLACFS